MAQKVLILFSHPAMHKSRINNKLVQAVEDLENVTVHKIYEEYPDFLIDIKHEQQLLLEHDVIIWHHPFYWYSAPPILKEWIDLVLEHGFAYGSKGNALKGKRVMQAITTGGRREGYHADGHNHYTIRQLLAPFEQTARLCKMHFLSPFVVHGTHLLSAEETIQHAENYRKTIISLRDDIFELKELQDKQYINDLII